MTMSKIAIVAAAATLWAGAIGSTAAQDPAVIDPNATYDRLPAGPGRDVLIKACVTCHNPERAASVRLTRDGWDELIGNMMTRGMKATDDERAVIVEYLATHFLGEAPRPININTAEPLDFEMVLGMLRREAAAIVAHRDLNGPFKAVTELRKVKGIDYTKVEKNQDRIVAFVPGSR
jgi:competence protein ComEA